MASYRKGRWHEFYVATRCTGCQQYMSQRKTDIRAAWCGRCRKETMALTLTGKAEGASGAWNELEADVYDATLSAVEDGGVSQFDGKEQFKFTFTLDETDDAGDQITLFKWCNKVLAPKSNIAGIVAACGVEWKVGEPFDLESLAGRRVRVMVNISDKTGRRYVADVLPPKGAAKAAPAKAAVKPAPAAAKAASNVDDVCCVPKCGKGVEVYDDDGTPFCAKHAP